MKSLNLTHTRILFMRFDCYKNVLRMAIIKLIRIHLSHCTMEIGRDRFQERDSIDMGFCCKCAERTLEQCLPLYTYGIVKHIWVSCRSKCVWVSLGSSQKKR